MNCPRHFECSLYADEMLFGAERQHFAEHLRQCPACRRHTETLAALRRDMHALPSPALGFDLAARLESQLRRPPRRLPGWLTWGMPGATAALSLALGVWLGSGLLGGAAVGTGAATLRVFDPVPPGGLCTAPELCRMTKG